MQLGVMLSDKRGVTELNAKEMCRFDISFNCAEKNCSCLSKLDDILLPLRPWMNENNSCGLFQMSFSVQFRVEYHIGSQWTTRWHSLMWGIKTRCCSAANGTTKAWTHAQTGMRESCVSFWGPTDSRVVSMFVSKERDTTAKIFVSEERERESVDLFWGWSKRKQNNQKKAHFVN